MIEEGRSRRAGRFATTAEALRRFASTLTPEDHVVLEATCNTEAIARVLRQHAGRVVISNPLRTRAIADAKIKTETVDATVLAQLLASGFLPEVWLPDEVTAQRRRQVARRAQVVRQRTQIKHHIHAILHRNLVPPCPYADLFGKVGRAWLATQSLPADEQQTVASLLRMLDQFTAEVAGIEQDLAEETLACGPARRLMTIPGVDAAIAMTLVAAVGEIARFSSAQKLVSYLGLDPRVRQSGLHPATHGRISKQGHAHARSMLVQAAWAVTNTPGPLRAFFLRLRARRGKQIAVVATARKLAVLVWHLWSKEQDYLWARPSLTATKLRTLELHAGRPARRGHRGPTVNDRLQSLRNQELAIGEQAERAYAEAVARWQPRRPARQKSMGVSAAKEERIQPYEARVRRRESSTSELAVPVGVAHAHDQDNKNRGQRGGA